MDVAAWLHGLGLESCVGVPRQRNRLGRAAEALGRGSQRSRRGYLEAIAAGCSMRLPRWAPRRPLPRQRRQRRQRATHRR